MKCYHVMYGNMSISVGICTFGSINLPRKLWPKRFGPFEISRNISPLVYELDLPDEYRLENPFNIS